MFSPNTAQSGDSSSTGSLPLNSFHTALHASVGSGRESVTCRKLVGFTHHPLRSCALLVASLALLLGLPGQLQAAGNFTWNSTLTTYSGNMSGNWSTSLVNGTIAMNATSAAAPTNNLIFTGNNSITANNRCFS